MHLLAALFCDPTALTTVDASTSGIDATLSISLGATGRTLTHTSYSSLVAGTATCEGAGCSFMEGVWGTSFPCASTFPTTGAMVVDYGPDT